MGYKGDSRVTIYHEMYKCIEDKKYDEAEKIVDILDKKTNGYADGISKARILISRGKRREAN